MTRYLNLFVSVLTVSMIAWPTHSQVPTDPSADGEGALSIIAWAGSIERGETDKNYDWVTAFETSTGCKVTVTTATNSDEMIAMMRRGGVDLITASSDAGLRLILGGQVRPLNTELIPNWKNIDPRLLNSPWHTQGSVHYGTPFQWSPTILAYNTDVFKEPPESWSVVFTEQVLSDGKSNKGRVQAHRSPFSIANAALYLRTARPDLGIKNPYELYPWQFAAAVDLLREQRPLLGGYWQDALVQADEFNKGTVVASSSWPFQVNLLQADKKPVASTFPSEGTTGWADTFMMHITAPHPNCSYAWLNYSLELKVQGDVAAWLGSVPSVPAACTGNMLLTDSGCETNGANSFDQVWFWQTPGLPCIANGTCVPYTQWEKEFSALQYEITNQKN